MKLSVLFRDYLLFFIGIVFSQQLYATDYYVNDGVTGETGAICSAAGAAGNTGLTSASPKATIAQILALGSIRSTDVIYVDVGTYTSEAELLNGNSDDYGFTIEGVLVNGVSVSVFNYNSGNAHFIYLSRGESDNITLKNLYIQGYKPTGATSYGGFLNNSASSGGDGSASGWTIQNCVIDDCDAVTTGGGIYWNDAGTFTVTGTTFKNCSATSAGAIYSIQAFTLSKCIFYGNTTSGDGSAVYLTTSSATNTFTNCLFYDNTITSTGVGAIFLADNGQTLTMYNCTVANNIRYGVYKSQSGSSVFCYIYNSILYGNTISDAYKAGGALTVSYSCYGVSNATVTTGSLTANTDPLFDDSDNDDYHISTSSPCIDAGTGTPGTGNYPTDDLDGVTRIAPIDIGCYEACANADSPTATSDSPTCTPTDVTITASGSPSANNTWYWQTSSSGTSTTDNATSSYTATASGTYYIRAYYSIDGCWGTASSITVSKDTQAPTTATAGSDVTIPTCGTPALLLGANTATIGTGAWTVTSGPSTNSSQFASTSDPNTTFTPDGGSGTYVLRWTISNGCGSSYDEVSITVSGASYSGTLTVGVSGCHFTSLTDALTKLGSCGYTGNIVLELQTNFDGTSTTETFPLDFASSSVTPGSSTTITIRPASDVASALSITGSHASYIIHMNGTDYVTFDGRPGGAGSNKYLTIENTNTAGDCAVKLIADATNNTFKYCTLKALDDAATSAGVVWISTATTTGNDDNTFDYCVFDGGCDATASPTSGVAKNGIYSSGTTAKTNSNITVSNCEFKDVWSVDASASSVFINLDAYNDSWTISGNSFYQTNTRTATGAQAFYGVKIDDGSGYTISSNYFGGSAASCSGTWIQNSTSTNYTQLYAIALAVGTSSTTSVQGNTFNNLTWDIKGGNTWSAIYITSGNVDVGTTSANTIGATTGTGTITLVNTTGTPNIYGIYSSSTGTVNIENNTIGSITTSAGSGISFNFYGIYTSGASANCSVTSNYIGSASTSNSIQFGDGSTTTGVNSIYGIYNTATGTISISSNTIKNVTAYGTSTSKIYGIYSSASASSLTISSNSISYLENTGTSYIAGIYQNTNIANTISSNTIENITSADFSGTFYGIFEGITSATATVSSNTIQNITFSKNAVQTIRGFHINGSGIFNADNNTLYALKATSSGNYQSIISGFYFTSTAKGTLTKNKISGFQTSNVTTTGTPILYGIYSNGGSATPVFYLINNYFEFDNNSITTSNVSIYGVYGFNSHGLVMYYNTIKLSGSSATAGGGPVSACLYDNGNTNYLTYAKNNIFQNNITSNTNYVIYENVAHGSGEMDYNFYKINKTAASTVAYQAGNKTLATFNSAAYGGVNSIYVSSDSGTDISIGALGAISQSDANVVGQGYDLSSSSSYPNCQDDIQGTVGVRSSKGGTLGCYEQALCSTPYVGPLTWKIGSGDVGGDDFATLTAAIAALENCDFSGIITLELQNSYDAAYSSANETYPLRMSSLVGVSAAKHIVIQPATGVAATISGSNSGGSLLYFNGGDYITVDGSTGTSLTIQNTAASAASNRVILMENNATNNTINSCTIKGDNSSTTASTAGIVFIGDGATDNTANTFSENTLTWYSASTASLIVSVNSTGSTSANTFSTNKFVDFLNWGLYISTGGTTATITNNDFYTSSASLTPTANVYPIYVSNTGSGYTISGNDIGGRAVDCGADNSPYTLSSTAYTFTGIYLSSGTASTNSIQGNTIKNITHNTTLGTASGAGIFAGIYVAATGTINIGTSTANTIGNLTSAGASTNTLSGILVVSTTSGGWIQGIGVVSTSGTATIQKNIIGCIGTSNVSAKGYVFYGINTSGSGTIIIGGNGLENTIGSTSVSSSIVIGGAATASGVCKFYGIDNSATGVITISYNNIYNINVYGTGASTLYGINNTGGSDASEITYNTIKTLSLSGTGTTGIFYGIYQSAVITLSVSYNTISAITITNATVLRGIAIVYGSSSSKTVTLTGNTVGTSGEIISATVVSTSALNVAGEFCGIYVSSTGNTLNFTSNTISYISGVLSGTNQYTIEGIYVGSGAPSLNFDSNIIKQISNKSTQTGTTGAVYGMNITTISSTSSTFKKNMILNLSMEGDGTLDGIDVARAVAGTINFINNFISMKNYDGTSTYTNRINMKCLGLSSSSATPVNNIYYNTFEMGGNAAATTSRTTYCIYIHGGGTAISSTIYNNIIKNSRTSGASEHYTVYTHTSTTSTLDYNYYINPTTASYAKVLTVAKTDGTFNASGNGYGGLNSTYSTTANDIVLADDAAPTVNSGSIDGIIDLYSVNSDCREDINGNTTQRNTNPQVAGTAHMGCYEAAITSTITLATNAISAADNCQSATKVSLQSFSLAVTTADGNLTDLGFTTSGTFVQADISKYQLWYHTANDITGASQLGTDLTPTGGNGTTETFAAFASPTLTSGSTYYFWITMDVAAGATNGNTIAVDAIATTDLTSTSTKAGSTSAGGTQTLKTLPSVSVQPTAGNICVGGSYSPSITATGGATLSYQWQFSTDDATWGSVADGTPANSTYTNGTTATLSESGNVAAGSAYYYRCVVSSTGNGCSSVNSNSAQLTINADPSISVQPSAGNICVGGTYSPSITATGGTSLTYQWEFSTDNSSWGSVVDGTPANSTYTNGTTNNASVDGSIAAGSAYYYRCVVSDAGSGCGSVNSNGVQLTINALPTITTGATPAVVTGVTYNAGAQQTSLTYTASTNSPTSYSIDWASGITDQGSTAHAFAGGGSSIADIDVTAGVAAGTYTGTMTYTNGNGCSGTKSITITISAGSTTYYYDGTGNMSDVTNWGTNTDGTGSNPSDLTSGSMTFYVLHNGGNSTPSNDATWTLGASSKIIVGDGTNATNFTIGSGFTITGTVDVANNATLTIIATTPPTFGTIDAGSTIEFQGAATQTIASGTTFGSLTINNANGVNLTDDATVEGTLTLSSGNLTIPSAGTLTLGTTSTNVTLSGGSSTSYIVTTDNTSTIKRYVNSNTGYVFPMGDATYYSPMTFTLNSNGGLTNAYLSTYVVDAVAPGFAEANFTSYISRYWSVEQTGMTSPNYDISYTYDDTDITGTESTIIPVKVSSGTWYKPSNATNITNGTSEGTGSITEGTNTLSWTGLTTFSFDMGAGDEAAALPISLLSFTAKPQTSRVRLDWSTASEENNDYFTIERSIDGEHFYELFRKQGAGVSTTNLYYFGYDNQPVEGISYYRLKQTDYNGQFAYSDIESVNFNGKSSNKETVNLIIYPNPSENGKFHVRFDARNQETYHIAIYDAVGKLVYYQDYEAEKGVNDHIIELQGVASGIYQLEIRNDTIGVITKNISM